MTMRKRAKSFTVQGEWGEEKKSRVLGLADHGWVVLQYPAEPIPRLLLVPRLRGRDRGLADRFPANLVVLPNLMN